MGDGFGQAQEGPRIGILGLAIAAGEKADQLHEYRDGHETKASLALLEFLIQLIDEA